MEVSPDGSLRGLEDGVLGSPSVGVELKCPDPNVQFRTPVPYEFPWYYALQVLSEMKVLNVSKLVFLSWTPTTSTVFEVEFCEATWQKAWELTEHLYGGTITKPTRLPEECHALQDTLKDFVASKVTLLGEVPSV